MMHAVNLRLWWRILLIAIAAVVVAATFMAYFSSGVLVDFANMRLC